MVVSIAKCLATPGHPFSWNVTSSKFDPVVLALRTWSSRMDICMRDVGSGICLFRYSWHFCRRSLPPSLQPTRNQILSQSFSRSLHRQDSDMHLGQIFGRLKHCPSLSNRVVDYANRIIPTLGPPRTHSVELAPRSIRHTQAGIIPSSLQIGSICSC